MSAIDPRRLPAKALPPRGGRLFWLPFAALLGMSLGTRAQSVWTGQTANSDEILNAAAHGLATFVGVGSNGVIISSPGSGIWSEVPSGTSATLRTVAFAGGQFVAAGSDGTILTSPDGSVWASRQSGVTNFLSGSCYGNGVHVVVGTSGRILTSPDAITWTAVSSGTGLSLQSVHFAAGLFVACGEIGTILTSPDGANWTIRDALITAPLLSSNYFRGRHYVVGFGGMIASSSDGVEWREETSGTDELLHAIVSDGTNAVVSGTNGTLLKSADGISWTSVPSGETATLRGATFGQSRFVVVGGSENSDAVVLVGERDPGILWKTNTVSINEAAGTATLTVDRLGPADAVASVAFQTVQGTATSEVDYLLTSGTATFEIGDSATEISIPIINNPEAEPEEELTVVLTNPTPANLALYDPVSTVTIIDAQDSDFDGLPDEWELLHFNSVDAFGPDDDPDGDNNSNARELEDGTDPDDANSASYLLFTAISSGLGSLAIDPELAEYPAGTVVTLTPMPSGEFTFVSWQGDLSGTTNPLVLTMTRDLNIEAAFELSLGNALDDTCLEWILSGSGPAWEAQGVVSSDGADAAEVGGLLVGERSTIEATVGGPAEISFHWRLASGPFDKLEFRIGPTWKSELAGTADWQTESFIVGTGDRQVSWTYSENSTFGGGEGKAWLDQISISYGFEPWRLVRFNRAGNDDPLISGPTADPDNDGNVNLVEYLLDLEPRVSDAGSPNLPVVSIEQVGEEHHAAVTWSQHHKRAEHVAVAVEFSPSLAPGSWQELEEAPQLIARDGALDTVHVIHPVPLSTAPRGFFRLKLSLLP